MQSIQSLFKIEIKDISVNVFTNSFFQVHKHLVSFKIYKLVFKWLYSRFMQCNLINNKCNEYEDNIPIRVIKSNAYIYIQQHSSHPKFKYKTKVYKLTYCDML